MKITQRQLIQIIREEACKLQEAPRPQGDITTEEKDRMVAALDDVQRSLDVAMKIAKTYHDEFYKDIEKFNKTLKYIKNLASTIWRFPDYYED